MMSLKLSLIFVQLYCLFVVTKCVENSQFDISDATADASSYFTTRSLDQGQLPSNEIQPSAVPPVKPIYTLARHFVNDLEILLHKITQTFVKIGRTQEGQKTLYHIYDEFSVICSNEVSTSTLKYTMARGLEAMQDPNTTLVVVEFIETIRDLMQYDLVDWYFLLPFLRDICRHPAPEKLIEIAVAEIAYILEDEDRKNTVAAAFNMLQEGLVTAASEASKATSATTMELTKDAKPVKIEASEKAATTSSVASVAPSQIQQVTTIPVESVTTVPVEPVAQNPAAPESLSTASKIMKRVKSLPSYFTKAPVENV